MGISKTEAASALTDIERTAGRSRELKGYQVAAPILMVWGVVWAIGYSAMGLLRPERWGLVWLVVDAVGIVATILLSRRPLAVSKAAGRPGTGWRIAASSLSIMAFIVASYTVFQPTTVEPAIVFPGLVTGLVYAGVGIAFMRRFLWIGVAVFAASLIGYFFFQPMLAFWMAAVGGGGLIVAGLWLRRA
ncbi:hypothetical protein BH10PSE4_BH10PSE4_11170 [soil metagenome]